MADPILLVVLALAVLLGARDFVWARRGLRTGIVEGMLIGFWGRQCSRTEDPDAFWANVCAGFFMAALGAIAFLWAVSATVMVVMQRFGLGAAL